MIIVCTISSKRYSSSFHADIRSWCFAHVADARFRSLFHSFYRIFFFIPMSLCLLHTHTAYAHIDDLHASLSCSFPPTIVYFEPCLALLLLLMFIIILFLFAVPTRARVCFFCAHSRTHPNFLFFFFFRWFLCFSFAICFRRRGLSAECIFIVVCSYFELILYAEAKVKFNETFKIDEWTDHIWTYS